MVWKKSKVRQLLLTKYNSRLISSQKTLTFYSQFTKYSSSHEQVPHPGLRSESIKSQKTPITHLKTYQKRLAETH